MLRLGAVVAIVIVLCGAVASAGDARLARVKSTKGTPPLQTAIMDPQTFGGPQSAKAFALTKAAGASYVRLLAYWNSIAPATRPAGFDPSDPTTPGYHWTALDASVANAEAAGLTPIVDITHAPKWADSIKPKGYNAGTPDTTQLGDFATAIATHFDGSVGPAVHVFQIWNEPNNSLDLSPVNPNVYRNMVNAAAASIHAVSPSNLVIAGGMDPFTNKANRFYSTAPLTFMRSMLCVSAGKHPHATCKTQVHFDIWSHHPYSHWGPTGKAKLPNDISIGDLPKMRAVLKTAEKLHRVVSSQSIQFWVTEIGWDSNPPRKGAAPIALEARWTSEAMHTMWSSGVTLVTWYLLQDAAGNTPYDSGLYFHAKNIAKAKAKPGLTAFRFPFVAYLKGKKVNIWGRDLKSSPATITIQRRHGTKGAWRTVAKLKANKYGIFEETLRLSATKTDWMRATSPGSGKSLAFSLNGALTNQRYSPFGY